MDESDLLPAEGFRDRVSTVTAEGKRKWIYAHMPQGFFYRLRANLSIVYITLFFGLPFVYVNDMPFILLNFPEGKFILFSKIFWPQDFFIFAVAMIAFIIFIALFTVIYGRLFCGWACPQTIFMEFVFRKMEWWIEGPAAKQKAADQRDWTLSVAVRKLVKHLVFFLLSFLIANTFLSYIFGIDQLVRIIREPLADHLVLFSGILVFTLLFYAVYAFVRDLVCTTICPYGRLQSVLFDRDTMQISYDYVRGEPRERLRKNAVREGGDCVDCHHCVDVCPTGIDIRDGVQMECVGCTACIDACNRMMEKAGLPLDLIRYASENEIRDKKPFVFTNRMKAYTAVLSVLVLVMIALLITRRPVDTYISRVKGQLYQELPQNQISNLFFVKIINKTREEKPIAFRVEKPKGSIQLIGRKDQKLKPEAISEMEFFVAIDRQYLKGYSTPIDIGVYSGSEKTQTIHTTFLGPYNATP